MDFLELARRRWSVTDYQRRAVERDKLDKILAAGLAAPTAGNLQPQRIVTIDSEEGRQHLEQVIPGKCRAPAALLVCYDKRECWTRPADGKASGELDAAIVTTHMMLAATDLGLGSLWIMNWDPRKMKAAFALPEEIEPTALLLVGYAAPDARPRPGHLTRKAKEDILL